MHSSPVCGLRPLLCFRKPTHVEVQKKVFFLAPVHSVLDSVMSAADN